MSSLARRTGGRAPTLALICGLFLTAGCSVFRPAKPVAPPEPLPNERLARAEELLAASETEAAAAEFHGLISDHPSSPEAPEALFQLAVVYLAPTSPLHDASQGITLLENLTTEYPTSAWALAASTIVQLARTTTELSEVAAALQNQLERLKQIDIGPDG